MEFLALKKKEYGRRTYIVVRTPYGFDEEVPAPIRPYFFVESSNCTEGLRGINGECVEKIEVDVPSDVPKVAKKFRGRKIFEGDIPFVRRMTTDLGWELSRNAKIGFIDIEADDSRGFPDPSKDKILSIALIKSDGTRRWYYIGDYVREDYMLRQFIKDVSDVSVLVTWNGGEDWYDRAFDFPYLAGRARVFGINLPKELWWVGLLDFMMEYKRTMRPKKASLDYVAEVELGEGKIDIGNRRVADLSRRELEEYNVRDAELLYELEKKFMFAGGFLEKMRIAHQPEPTHGTIRLIDTIILRKARELGYVLPNAEVGEQKPYRGAIVLEPKAGVHKNVVFFDVNSLYPNVIINEGISPDKERKLYPETLKELLELRFEYKRKWKETGDPEYYVKQYALKILVNAFYGALANPAFRLFDADLAARVTEKGRNILLGIKNYVESLGFEVLYGDTDSVAVKIEPRRAEALARMINRRFAPYSVKVDKVFISAMFPGQNGRGVKKRYAGLTPTGEIEVTGFEVIRGDAFDLLKEFSEKLLELVLRYGLGEVSKDDIINYADDIKRRLFKGEFDDRLAITKKFKDLDSYKANAPHVRAIKKLQRAGYSVKHMRFVEFYWMKRGGKTDAIPTPLMGEYRKRGWSIDYKKYWSLLESAFNRICGVISLDSRFLKGQNKTLFGG